ncbi:hypothetical protein [Dyella sp. GSA-30]|uniref:hypothetical protein n=1 Tax=Dyella sp. GSA-30 TaxID=2994496 RepID=UPI00248FBD91|nr:hypothetical protein [Dyella sp. GSA-30]
MKGNEKIWLFLRIVLLVVALIHSVYFVKTLPGDFSRPFWPFFFEMIGIVAVSVFGVTFFQLPKQASDVRWAKPSWFANPFRLRQALPIFDLAAYYFLVLGLGCLAIGLSREPRNWALELPLSIGIGAFLGVRVVLMVFKDRFEDA